MAINNIEVKPLILNVDASKSQRIQIENIMKKVLAANFMPEDLSGETLRVPWRPKIFQYYISQESITAWRISPQLRWRNFSREKSSL